ncbi:tRNA (guanine(10)-N2)-methyltransferase [Podosphaera aphanis]|nr:tRNA (guanine(10)-N2)-methyltransferase [Podosphaera aphanis]
MKYLIRFAQTHETFRIAEIQALAVIIEIELEILLYRPSSPFCIVQVPSEEAAIKLVQRSILAKAVYEVWGEGVNYEALHENCSTISSHLWPRYTDASFKFVFDIFQATRSTIDQRELINGFSFLNFKGPIKMKKAEQEFCIFEEWPLHIESSALHSPDMIYLGRYLGSSDRTALQKYDLKKRKYICTTSMDAELALITANISLAAPGKLFYDPFVGSGSFTVACAHYGALAFGSDIDGRSIRGKGDRNLQSNFLQYRLKDFFGDSFVADLTNSPLRAGEMFDGIVCDPPYGVREGLKVLGSRDPTKGKEPVYRNGQAHHTMESYIPPKRPYGLLDILDDILDFAAISLVENGRLSFWMPTANDEDQEIQIPQHPYLHITSICVQSFSKWSRRLITYRRIPDSDVAETIRERRAPKTGVSADDLNPFRRGYFKGFKPLDA